MVLGRYSCQFRDFLVGFYVHVGLFLTGFFCYSAHCWSRVRAYVFPHFEEGSRCSLDPLSLARFWNQCYFYFILSLVFFSVLDHVTVPGLSVCQRNIVSVSMSASMSHACTYRRILASTNMICSHKPFATTASLASTLCTHILAEIILLPRSAHDPLYKLSPGAVQRNRNIS